MCGIVGLWRSTATQAIELWFNTSAMADAISLRGPDNSGIWFDEDSGLELARRCPSIVDPSPAGYQSMHSPRSLSHVALPSGSVD